MCVCVCVRACVHACVCMVVREACKARLLLGDVLSVFSTLSIPGDFAPGIPRGELLGNLEFFV